MERDGKTRDDIIGKERRGDLGERGKGWKGEISGRYNRGY